MRNRTPNFFSQTPDPWAETRPQTVSSGRTSQHWDSRRGLTPTPQWTRKRRRRVSCLPFLLLGVLILILGVYFLAPLRTNVLILGIDYTPWYSAVGRSDTIILTTIKPFEPYVGMLSIPRDLWVTVPGYGENRINTAHFFAEAQQTGSGPAAAMQTVRSNFGVDVDYYLRIRFDGFREVINAMGGVDLDLPEPMAGYPAGQYHLSGNKALAFARHRMGSDDFFRMENGQFLVKAVFSQMLKPRMWPRLPAVALALERSVDTNVPVWEWPRIAMALLRAGPDGIDSRTIDREMVTPILTEQGANVLLPNWTLINPVLMDMFGQ